MAEIDERMVGWIGLQLFDAQGERLVARVEKGRVKGAPGVAANKILADTEEQKLCTYYGLDYVSSPWEPVEGCVGEEKEAEASTKEP